jgi:hypothetical protein
MPVHDIVAINTCLLNFSVKCYPDNIDYVDKVFEDTETIFNNMNLDQ